MLDILVVVAIPQAAGAEAGPGPIPGMPVMQDGAVDGQALAFGEGAVEPEADVTGTRRVEVATERVLQVRVRGEQDGVDQWCGGRRGRGCRGPPRPLLRESTACPPSS